MNWDNYFMLIATACAAKSKDPSTKVGSIIVGPDRNVLTTGFNGFPRGVLDTEERLNDRKTKLALIAHAERNAMDQAARHGISLRGSTLYVTPIPPCAECAKSIIQSGIVRVVCPPIDPCHAWHDSTMLAFQMFEEAGIRVDEIKIA